MRSSWIRSRPSLRPHRPHKVPALAFVQTDRMRTSSAGRRDIRAARELIMLTKRVAASVLSAATTRCFPRAPSCPEAAGPAGARSERARHSLWLHRARPDARRLPQSSTGHGPPDRERQHDSGRALPVRSHRYGSPDILLDGEDRGCAADRHRPEGGRDPVCRRPGGNLCSRSEGHGIRPYPDQGVAADGVGRRLLGRLRQPIQRYLQTGPPDARAGLCRQPRCGEAVQHPPFRAGRALLLLVG